MVKVPLKTHRRVRWAYLNRPAFSPQVLTGDDASAGTGEAVKAYITGLAAVLQRAFKQRWRFLGWVQIIDRMTGYVPYRNLGRVPCPIRRLPLEMAIEKRLVLLLVLLRERAILR